MQESTKAKSVVSAAEAACAGVPEIVSRPLTADEIAGIKSLTEELAPVLGEHFDAGELTRLRDAVKRWLGSDVVPRGIHGLPKASLVLETATTFASAIDADHDILAAILLYPLVSEGMATAADIRADWGDDVHDLITGIEAVSRFSSRNNAVNQENFRGLLLSLAKDIRVIIVMIVHNLVLMRNINHHPDEEWVRNVAFEANYLYAQLAHRLGLYKIKGVLEDLSLKYTDREIYTQIARKLNETKRERDAYIADFIAPVKAKLEAAGLKFDIKGRTKSISSIWAKMRKQKVDMQHIYDLFAIRVIIDTPRESEKSDCWLAYSILADMYTANPARMKDWITIPKSNGYESLHATVMGPGSKWVEVQIRTRRMDLVAEKGLAAHWRYKGVKGDSSDQWMNNVRDILERADSGPMQQMKQLKPDSYEKEVFAFTPKGDLHRMPAGATVLDFAFMIHSNVGAHCMGAVVNGKNRRINYRIKSGDTVEIVTSASQTPKHDWLNIVVTTKARNKIRQSINEAKLHRAELGKEMLQRRARNRKLDIDEALLMRLIKKMGYKFSNDFYADIADEKADVQKFLATYVAQRQQEQEAEETRLSAEEFQIQTRDEAPSGGDVMLIGGKSIKGLSYKFAKCCSPIYGDDVFGFISADGVMKIHRCDCPNAANIRSNYPYRIVRTEWSGKAGALLPVTLRIVGNDDLGIVTNITSIIAKEPAMDLRNISIDAHDGIFQGFLVINVSDTRQLNQLVKKIRTVKGVKDVSRTAGGM